MSAEVELVGIVAVEEAAGADIVLGEPAAVGVRVVFELGRRAGPLRQG